MVHGSPAAAGTMFNANSAACSKKKKKNNGQKNCGSYF